MNELIIKDDVRFENYIYEVRGQRVMLDSDLAMFFEYETKQLNRQVARNIKRFPKNYCFQLTESEYENLRCQFVTSKNNEIINNNNRGGRRYLPYVFTEQGIAMLSALLKSDVAVHVSINIMKAFIEMRKFLNQNGQVFERLTNVEYKLLEHDKNFDLVFNQLQISEVEKQKIFYEGQIYDAYSLIIQIIKKANKKY